MACFAAMTSPHLTSILEKIASAKSMAKQLAAHLDHPGLQGQVREIALKQCVEPFLTQSFTCGTGKVIDSMSGISDQIDLVFYHRKLAPPILLSPELGLFPVECVKYVFEVKTTITAEAIRDANRKFRSVLGLSTFPQKQPDGSIKRGELPVPVLFGFSSDLVGSEIERYLKHTPDEAPPATVICILGKSYWFYSGADRKWFGADVHDADDAVGGEFAGFISGFMNSLAREETTIRAFQPGSYVGEGYLTWTSYP